MFKQIIPVFIFTEYDHIIHMNHNRLIYILLSIYLESSHVFSVLLQVRNYTI